MERIYFATSNKEKLERTRVILGDKFEVLNVNIETAENGVSCDQNARQKLLTARCQNPLAQTLIAEDYAIEIEGITLKDACPESTIKALTKDINISDIEAFKLPFPGIFASRILKYFEEESLLSRILSLSASRIAITRLALAVHDTRDHINSMISISEQLHIQDKMIGNGWFWNKISQDVDGLACTSNLWIYKKSLRARALNLLAKKILQISQQL